MATGALRRLLRRVPALRRAALTARFGHLARTEPLSEWGYERGTPVDRWYLERYLRRHADVVTGRVLEVKSDQYASRLGASEVEVVDLDPTNRRATVVGDLCDPATLASGRYDAALVTQTLQYVGDPAAALRNLVRSLRPGGSLLLTVPSLSRVSGPSDLWRWTPAGFTRLLETAVPPEAIRDVSGPGNGLAGRAFLFGLAAEDLPPAALDRPDPEYPVVVCALVQAPA